MDKTRATRMSARIYDLKKQGHIIEDGERTIHGFKQYRLIRPVTEPSLRATRPEETKPAQLSLINVRPKTP
jgi:hypothetical protein